MHHDGYHDGDRRLRLAHHLDGRCSDHGLYRHGGRCSDHGPYHHGGRCSDHGLYHRVCRRSDHGLYHHDGRCFGHDLCKAGWFQISSPYHFRASVGASPVIVAVATIPANNTLDPDESTDRLAQSMQRRFRLSSF